YPARIPVDGADLHEVRIREASHRVAPSHVIQDVARLHPELGPITTDREAAEDAQVEVVVRGTAEEVASGVAPLVARLSKRRRIVVHRVRSCVADATDWRNLLNRLTSLALIQRSVVAVNRERDAGVDLVDAVDLPVLNNRRQRAGVVLCKRQ